MACKAGYPDAPCPFNSLVAPAKVTRSACGACKNFVPPKHILAWCSLYDRDKTICQLPKSACETCPFKVERGPGRPPEEGKVDWKDPDSVAKYHAEWREKNEAKTKSAQERFKARHPDYWKDYYKRNAEKLKASVRAYQQKGKVGGEEGSS